MNNSRMSEAAALFNEVNIPSNPYGYYLLPSYDDIFITSNEFNHESIFEISDFCTKNGKESVFDSQNKKIAEEEFKKYVVKFFNIIKN